MRVTLISGLWPTKDECGLVPLADQISKLPSKPEIEIHHYQDSKIPASDVYIGHSLGGERAVNLAKYFQVKYLALIEPVAGGWFPFFFWVPGQNFTVPANVEKADCFKRTGWGLPPSSKILNSSLSFKNYSINASHADAPRDSFVVEKVLAAIGALRS